MATNKVTTNVIDMSGNTGGLVWAKGTTAQRPTGVAGDLRLNTTDSRLEYKDNADWKRFSEGAASPSVDFEADFLVIAGGGGGGDESSSTLEEVVVELVAFVQNTYIWRRLFQTKVK